MNIQHDHHEPAGASRPDKSGSSVSRDNLFGTDRRPFEERADPAYSFLTPDLEEAFAAVEYEIRFGKGAMLIVGEAGVGKTQFIRSLLPRLSAKDHAVVLTWPASGKPDLIRETCKAFGVSISSTRDNDSRRLARLGRHLSRHVGKDARNVVLVDQAENLSDGSLIQLAALTELESDDTKLLTIVLAAQPRLRDVLNEPKHARLGQRLFGERILVPLTEDQTARYIRHRLTVAGNSNAELFEPEAIAWIHDRAVGIPRLINHLCRQAMLAAYGADESTITLRTLASLNEPGVTQERSMDVDWLGLTSNDDQPKSTKSHKGDWSTGDNEDTSATPSSNPDADASILANAGVLFHASETIEDDENDAAVLGSMDSLFVRGEALLNRLEQALARADRMAATSESTYAQHKAVETHLEALATRAERLITTLKKTTPDAIRTLSTAAKQVETIEKARSDGEKVEAKLIATAQTIAHKADEVQDRVAQLMDGMNQGQTVESRLTGLANKANEACGQCDERIERLADLLQQADNRADGLSQVLDGNALTDLEERLQAITNSTLETVTEIEARTAGAERTIAEAGDQFTEFESTCRDRILEICQSTIKDQRAAFQRALHEVAQASKRTIDAACDRAAEFVTDTESRVGALRSKCLETVQESEGRLESLIATNDDLTSHAESFRRDVDAIRDRAGNATERLESAVRSGETVLEQFIEERGRREQVQQSLSESMNAIDKVTADVREAEQQAKRCTQLSSELIARNARAEELLAKLDETASSLKNIQADIESSVAQATDQARRIDSHHAAASVTLKELASATIVGREAISSLMSSADATKELITHATVQVETLANVDAERKETAHRMGLLVQAAHKLDASLARRLDRAGDCLNSLIAQSETAHDRHGQFSDTLKIGQEVIERAERTVNNCEKSAEERTKTVERLIEDLWSLTGKAETIAQRIEKDAIRGESAASALAQNVGPAEEIRGELASVVEQATVRSEELAGRERSAAALLERLSDMSDTLEAARTLNETVAPLVQEARTLCDELSTCSVEARQQTVELHELRRVACDLTQTQTDMNVESDAVIRTLQEQLATAQACAQSSETMLVEFVERAEGIEKQMSDVDAKTRKIQSFITTSLAKPQQAVEHAKEQSDKLSRISEAVRKVSTGLAQTTLEAKHHLDALSQVNREAGARLAAISSLTSSTKRATDSLREWMEQSDRVHDQMEGALVAPEGRSQAPTQTPATMPSRTVNRQSIGDRSGVGGLSRLSKNGDAEPTLAHARTPVATAVTSAPPTTPVGATPRSAENAAEIAKLIEKTRRQAGVDQAHT